MKYAVIVVATVPVLLIYPFLQKYFVKGIMIVITEIIPKPALRGILKEFDIHELIAIFFFLPGVLFLNSASYFLKKVRVHTFHMRELQC